MVNVDIPDFGVLLDLVDSIHDLTEKRNKLKIKIEFIEAQVVKECRSNQAYYENGKPLSMEAIKNTVMFTGFENELIPLRVELAGLEANIESNKLKFDVSKMQLDLYRTEQANQRYQV